VTTTERPWRRHGPGEQDDDETSPGRGEQNHDETGPERDEQGHDETSPRRDEWGETSDAGEPPPRRREAEQEREEWQMFVRDLVTSVLAVLVVGAYLYAVSGVWPPLVAVESTSMTPNMKVNDLVFVMEPDRFPGPNAQGASGVVTAQAGRQVDYQSFGRHGDVIVYERDGNGQRVPIIHRAMFWVEKGENWYDRADSDHITATKCGESPSEGLANCPAPHAGFITKGDSNGRYDQVTSLSGPVKPGWVVGTAEVRVPNLGWIRLRSQAEPVGQATANRTDPGTSASP
jgi:Signal peptidase I